MKKFKVAVNGLNECVAAQLALFEISNGWYSGGKNVYAYATARELYVNEDGYMSYSIESGGHEPDTAATQVLRLTDGKLVNVADGTIFDATVAAAEVEAPARVERQVALSRGTDPSTSKAAGMSFDPTQLELEVLNAIRTFGDEGATQDDVLSKLRRISHSSITPRFRPLLNKGLLVDTGCKRKGVSGRSQRVMRAAA